MVILTATIWWNAGVLYRSETERTRGQRAIEQLLAEAECREADLRNQQQQLVQAAKLASIGELATGVARELNNPLNNLSLMIDNELDRLQEGSAAPQRLIDELKIMQNEVQRGASIVKQLRTFGRTAGRKQVPVALDEVLTDALELVRRGLELENITVSTLFPPEPPYVLGDRLELEQVFINLLMNARDALAPGPKKGITVSTSVTTDSVRVYVRDDGTGMSPEVQQRVFDPFFTTKPVGEGTGLGLSIMHGIIKAHHGVISVDSREGIGTCFTIELPRLVPPAVQHSRTTPAFDVASTSLKGDRAVPAA